MSKLLKAIAQRHRPHIAAQMTAENGYDETQHHFTDDLVKAGILSAEDAKDMEGCLDDLLSDGDDAANLIKAAANGEVSKDKLNDPDLVDAMMGGDLDDANDESGDDDDLDGQDDPDFNDEKVTA